MDVGTLVARAARRYSGRVALEGPDGSRTFEEVGANAARLARALLALGLEPGDRVLDLQTNSCTCVEAEFGMASAGVCRVALNYRLQPSDWERIADDCGARAIVYHARFATQAAPLVEGLGRAIVVGGDAPGTPWPTALAAQSATLLGVRFGSDALVSLNYSSGTTGQPKGAERTHRNRTASLGNIVTAITGVPEPADVWCHAGPLTHASGLFVLPHFTLGARQVILPAWDPEAFLEAVEQRRVTGTVLVPTMIARLLAHEGLHEERTRPLRRLAYAGAPMAAAQICEAHSRITRSLYQFYGLVEAMPPLTVLDPADHAAGVADTPDLLASAGWPCLGVDLAIVNEDGLELPAGETGEVVTRGDHVMRGYYRLKGRADDGTAAKVLRDGWLQTGDVGRLDESGRLYLVDRKGDMIISGGYNVYPREVEDVIAEVAGVDEVAVVGIADPEWGQRVVAVYTARDGAPVTDGAIAAHCRARLAGYKKPKEIHRVDAFPVSATGKIAKRELRARLEAKKTVM